MIETALSGYELLNDPLLNKGTAFTDAERDMFDLHGLLPPYVTTLDLQVGRRLAALRNLGTDLQKYTFLRGLQDTNETLFYALLTRNIEELMPIVYTPTVGLGCQQFSRIFRKPRGLFLSFPLKDRMRRILDNPRFDRVEAIVVSDGERILGLGDQGAGGMGIPIGKLSLYTACAGLHPSTTLPILLDVGTDNQELLADPLYIGWRHERVRGADYDEFVASFVDAVRARWPHVLLHWEDFAFRNANRLLAQYRDQLCSFNDDIQGTAAIAVGAILSAINVTGVPLTDQRIAVLGAGSAGTGISALLLRAMIEAGLPETRGAQPLLSRRPRRPVGRGHGRPAAVSGAVCAKPRPVGDLEARLAGSDRSCRRRRQRASDGPHRHIRAAPCLFREHCPRHGGPCSAAGDLSALQSDGAQRSDAAGFARLDRRPRRHRHRQPVPANPSATAVPSGLTKPTTPMSIPASVSAPSRCKARRISDGMFLAAARTIADLSPAKRDRERQSPAAARGAAQRSRSRWRSRSPSRPKPRAWRRPFRIMISARRSMRKCGSRIMRRIGGCHANALHHVACELELCTRVFCATKN